MERLLGPMYALSIMTMITILEILRISFFQTPLKLEITCGLEQM